MHAHLELLKRLGLTQHFLHYFEPLFVVHPLVRQHHLNLLVLGAFQHLKLLPELAVQAHIAARQLACVLNVHHAFYAV